LPGSTIASHLGRTTKKELAPALQSADCCLFQ